METSFEVVTILFNFHRWTCVVGPLALAMSLAVVPRCIYRLLFWVTWSKIDSVDRKR